LLDWPRRDPRACGALHGVHPKTSIHRDALVAATKGSRLVGDIVDHPGSVDQGRIVHD
jgi:hypothetical protein